ALTSVVALPWCVRVACGALRVVVGLRRGGGRPPRWWAPARIGGGLAACAAGVRGAGAPAAGLGGPCPSARTSAGRTASAGRAASRGGPAAATDAQLLLPLHEPAVLTTE